VLPGQRRRQRLGKWDLPGLLAVVFTKSGQDRFFYEEDETVADGRLDIAPTFVTLVPTGFQENSVDNSEHDILRVSVAVGTTGVAELSISVGRTASLDCLYWGEQYVG